jgi:hypothetical protein
MAPQSPALFFRTLFGDYPKSFLFFVASVYFVIKGFGYKAAVKSSLPVLTQQMHVDVLHYSLYANVIQLGWSMKPLVAAASDFLPIFGYHKRFYGAFLGLIGAIAIAVCALLPSERSAGEAATGCYFMVVVSAAGIDVLTEGKFSELMITMGGRKPHIVTWSYLWYILGGIVSGLVAGTVAQYLDARIVLWIVFPFFVVIGILCLVGFLPEARTGNCCDEKRNSELQPTDLDEPLQEASDGELQCHTQDPPQPTPPKAQSLPVIALGVVTGLGVIGVAIAALVAPQPWISVLLNCCLAAGVLVGIRASLPIRVFQAAAFAFGKEIFFLHTFAILDFFSTAPPACVPDGPHFDLQFYQFYGPLVSNVVGALAIILFQSTLARCTFRFTVFLTTAIKSLSTVFTIIFVKRWNRAIGISDPVMYIFSIDVFFQMCSMLDFMPLVVLLSKACPKGVETLSYALLAALLNMGETVSGGMSVLAAQALNISTSMHSTNSTFLNVNGTGNATMLLSEVQCNFENFPLLLFLGEIILPVAIFPLAWLVLPAERIDQ